MRSLRSEKDLLPALSVLTCPPLGGQGGFLRHPPMDYDEDDEELSRLEAEFHAKSAKLAFVFALIMAIGVVLVLGLRGLL